MLQQAQLREDIVEKDEQITHLKEEQDIQIKSITSSVATTDILLFFILHMLFFLWYYLPASEKELAEKLHKYRQLLLHAQNHINEHKKKLSDKQVFG